MHGNTLSATERLAAALLFYFQAGLDAQEVLVAGARGVSVPSPSEDDLRAVVDATPMARWRSVQPVAEALARDIVKHADRDPVDVARDVVSTVRRGQEFIERITGPMTDIQKLAAQEAARRKAARGSK